MDKCPQCKAIYAYLIDNTKDEDDWSDMDNIEPMNDHSAPRIKNPQKALPKKCGLIYSKSVKEHLGKMSFTYLSTVCAKAEANCPTTFPGIGQRLSWAFDDPAAVEGSEEERLEKFREVRDQIEKRIKLWIAEKGISRE